MTFDSFPTWKRRRFAAGFQMESESAKATLAAAKEKYGREIRVFETSVASATHSNPSDIGSPFYLSDSCLSTDFIHGQWFHFNLVSVEPDDFYEFTAEDYYRLLATKKEDKYLKTKKIREAEEAARRSRITKAVMRVRFPDNHTVEVIFHPSETIQCLLDFLHKVIAHPELPFYLYTTPPKKVIKDVSQDFYSAGFVPGAIVYFAHDVPKGDNDTPFVSPYIQEEVMSLKGVEYVAQEADSTVDPKTEPTASSSLSSGPEPRKPSDKKGIKPKWLKM